MLRENSLIAFVVDPSLRVLLWSNGLVQATNLTQDTVEERNVSYLPFLSEDNRDNTTAAIRQLFLEKESGHKRKMVVALATEFVPGAHTTAAASREILLEFTAAYFEEYNNVVCVGLKLESDLSSLLQDGDQDAAGTVSSLTSETPSGTLQDEWSTVSSRTSGSTSGFLQADAKSDADGATTSISISTRASPSA